MVPHNPYRQYPWRMMPKKVQPYGSGEDAEYAALTRSGREPATGFVNDLAATMTIREIAAQAVEAVRALNQLTAGAGELADTDEVRDVAGALARMGQELPQLCEQLARFLVTQREDARIGNGPGRYPDFVLAEVSEALNAAGRAADMMAAALTEAGTKAAGLNAASW
jgi:hypothetical protein